MDQQPTNRRSVPAVRRAIGYLTRADRLNGPAGVIFADGDRKLEEARARRQQARRTAREVA
jgi:hypothetical protein